MHQVRSPLLPVRPFHACALLGAALLALAAASPANAAERVVDRNNASCSNSSGQPFCTIAAAAAVAVAGDTVRVRAGVYPEAVTLTRSGTSAAPILFLGDPGATLSGGTNGFYLKGVSWVTVQGFTIVGTTSHGIRVSLCSNVTLAGNQVGSPSSKVRANGINVKSSSDFTLVDNVVTDTVAEGIYLSGNTGFVLRGGQVRRSGQPVSGLTKKGIYVLANSNALITGVASYDNSDAGIYLTADANTIRVTRTVTHGNARGYTRAAAGIDVRGPRNVLSGNVGYANEDSGFNVRNGEGNALVNNIAYNNGDHGIDLLGATGGRIIGNSVYGNVTAGINVEGFSTGATLANNIAVANGINSPRTDGNIRVHDSSVAGTTADYNLVNLPGAGVMYIWNSVKYSSLAALRAAVPGVEVHGIQADPRWVSPATGNFQLTAGSTAIDSADSGVTGATACDAENHVRVDDPAAPNVGAGPRPFDDRGALELGSSAPCP